MKLGNIFLGIWLVLQGLIELLNLSFRYDDLVVGVLALVAGVLVLVRK
jgi:hypothetical protein